MLEKVKKAMRITVDIYNDELQDLIAAALADLRLAGIAASVSDSDTEDPLVVRAVITYCRVHFGSPSDYDKIKASYDEQKAQMQYATGYGLEAEADG